MKKTLYKSILILLCLVLFGGSLSIVMVSASPEPNENYTVHTTSIVVFDQEPCNWGEPATTTITIPCYWQIISCGMKMQAHLDSADVYVRAIVFRVDGRGECIDAYRYEKFQTGGYGVIFPGQTKSFPAGTALYDMSNCKFAAEWPNTGSQWLNFIPENPSQTTGYFSPGEHEILAYITTPEPNSWISITLYFEYIDPIGDILNQISSNQDELEGLIDEKVSGWYHTYCAKHLRFSRETVDSMIVRHLNCGSITSSELFWLKLRFLYIKMAADDPDISVICDNTMNLIEDLKDMI